VACRGQAAGEQQDIPVVGEEELAAERYVAATVEGPQQRAIGVKAVGLVLLVDGGRCTVDLVPRRRLREGGEEAARSPRQQLALAQEERSRAVHPDFQMLSPPATPHDPQGAEALGILE